MNLDRTKAALVDYDAAEGLLKAQEARLTDDALLRRLEALDELGAAVGAAFAQDTADRNAYDTAALVRPCQWLRDLITKCG